MVIDDHLSLSIKTQDDIQKKVNQIKNVVEIANEKTLQYLEKKKEQELQSQRIEIEAARNLVKIKSRLKDINL